MTVTGGGGCGDCGALDVWISNGRESGKKRERERKRRTRTKAVEQLVTSEGDRLVVLVEHQRDGRWSTTNKVGAWDHAPVGG